MNKLLVIIKPYLRLVYRRIQIILGFYYNYKRYILYSGWKEDMYNTEERNYFSVKAYHGLEKSMSYKARDKTSGWTTAFKVLDLIKIAKKTGKIGYHDKSARAVLESFIHLPENKLKNESNYIQDELSKINFMSDDLHGVTNYTYNDFEKGILENPENFFLSRYSLREFKDKKIDINSIQRAIQLTMKTPSVCNRQAWHIYHVSEKNIKNKILKYQNGNKPFGKDIPNLFIITSDLKGFFAAEEHYQQWIDGGLLAMTLIYTLHSLGIASCPLNWSQSPSNDKKFREALKIKNEHSVVLLLAAGYPDDVNTVCVSQRRPSTEIFTNLDEG